MRVVAALGGNALLQRGEPLEPAALRRNARAAARALAPLALAHELIVTHGNGPQVGLLALQARAYAPDRVVPLDVLGAESDGWIGYVLAQELANALPGREVASLLTQVRVDPADPAFASPSKPIGPRYSRAQAEGLAAATGWQFAADGDERRRVVASPEPQQIVELRGIRLLMRAGHVVVCVGGGGIPVARSSTGEWCGVEAVVDKDLAAALLARELEADALLLLTDIDAVYLDWHGPCKRALRRATPAQLARHAFEAGTMGPKVAAASRFVRACRGRAAIGRLQDAEALLAGSAGTHISPEEHL